MNEIHIQLWLGSFQRKPHVPLKSPINRLKNNSFLPLLAFIIRLIRMTLFELFLLSRVSAIPCQATGQSKEHVETYQYFANPSHYIPSVLRWGSIVQRNQVLAPFLEEWLNILCWRLVKNGYHPSPTFVCRYYILSESSPLCMNYKLWKELCDGGEIAA